MRRTVMMIETLKNAAVSGLVSAVISGLGVFYLLNRWTKTYKKQVSEKDETKE